MYTKNYLHKFNTKKVVLLNIQIILYVADNDTYYLLRF